MNSILRRLLKGAAAVALAAGSVPLYLYLSQERMLFYPQPLGAGSMPNAHASEEVRIVAADGTRLHGWLIRAERALAPLIIYFGGNAEEVSALAASAARLEDWSLLLVNYRGYGASAGKPGERALFADALAIYDYARDRADIAPERIVAMGRSLGSGVAVYLARERPLAGVILVTPYDSITAVAEGIYPWLPVRFLLRHKFDSLARAPHIATPLLCLVAERDALIPPAHAHRLFEAWQGPREWLKLPADHDSIDAAPGYWEAVAAFLRARDAMRA